MSPYLLEDFPVYTALSCTWGDPSRIKPIIINGAVLHVTESVEAALRHLQHKTDTTALWIDQLCINQDDIAEKNKQVLLMKAIYKGAAQTVVWLGPAIGESDHLMDVLADVGNEAYHFGIMQLNLPELQRLLGAPIDPHKLAIKESLNRLVQRIGLAFPVKALQSFVDRPWWVRVWVVQELSVAREVIFACGEKRIPYHHLSAALFFFALYMWTTVPDFNSPKLLDSEKKMFLEAPVDSAASKMLSIRRRYLSKTGDEGYTPYHLLRNSHILSSRALRLQATDDRDKIYGLLGLARDAETLGIRPDYSKSCPKIYTEVAGALIKQGHVDLLGLCQFPKSQNDLPSWVPDWRASLRTPCGTDFILDTRFSASGKKLVYVEYVDSNDRVIDQQGVLMDEVEAPGSARRPLLAEVGQLCDGYTHSNDRVITLEGVRVDEVEAIGSAWTPLLEGAFDYTAAGKLLTEIDQFCNEASNLGNEIYQDPRVLHEARWRTAVGDKELTEGGVSLSQRATQSSCEGHKEMLRRVEYLTGAPNVPLHERLAFIKSFPDWSIKEISYTNHMGDMHNRRPYRSKKGHVGLGPANILPNDVVCILLGAQVPYVLRTTKSHQFELVGEAFVHGIMDGELMKKEPVTEKLTIC